MILIVEDSEDDVFILRRALKIANIAEPFHVVSDGAKAIQYLDSKGEFSDRTKHPLPLLVLLDIQLPHFTGLEVLESMRGQARLKRIPVIMLTSSSQPSDIMHAYDLGANAFLVKPSNLQQLTNMLTAMKLFWLDHNQFPTGG